MAKIYYFPTHKSTLLKNYNKLRLKHFLKDRSHVPKWMQNWIVAFDPAKPGEDKSVEWTIPLKT